MRAQLVLVCVALCLAITMAKSFKGRGGRKKFGGGSRERGGCTSVCSLSNQTSSTDVTAECKEGYECSSDSLDFLIRDDKFSASFCVEVEEEESPETTEETPVEEEPEDMDTENFIKFLLRRACRVINGTDNEEKTRRCPKGLECSLAAVGVEQDGHLLTATYCQDDEQTVDWMQVFNGRRRSRSSEEDSSDDSSASIRRFRGGKRGGFRRHRRDAREEFRGGPCNITDADGVEIDSTYCPEESACSVGPVVADDNGAAINVFFCEKPERPSKESSESSEETSEEEDEEEDEDEENVNDEEEDSDDDDEDENYDRIARKMFCNACSLSKNGTDVEVRVTCADDEDCSAGPISTDINGTQVSAKFCTTGEDFSLIKALQCRRKGGKGRKPGGRGPKGRKPKGRRGSKGHRRG